MSSWHDSKWRVEQERQLMRKAAALDEFSVMSLWEHVHRTFNYQFITTTLRKWWEEGLTIRKDRDGSWTDYQPCFRGRGMSPLWKGQAVYRWID